MSRAAARTLVMGDPQAPFARVLEVLEANRALGADGRLAPDVTLVSIGDHFDYDLKHPIEAGREGVAVLRWLASHDPAQVVLLLGNHDTARVMELVGLDDKRFAEARALARAMQGKQESDEDFERRFPDIPTAGLAARDYASYSEEQRELVVELLLAGRFHLALVGRLPDGRDVLITHAGVTRRELALLGIDAVDPYRIAAGLQDRLRRASDERRAEWARGERTPLSLEPLHVTGKSGVEGGGLLYHRPARSDWPEVDAAWEFDPERPRRFDPALAAARPASGRGAHRPPQVQGRAGRGLAERGGKATVGRRHSHPARARRRSVVRSRRDSGRGRRDRHDPHRRRDVARATRGLRPAGAGTARVSDEP